jgi:hypothetical protein
MYKLYTVLSGGCPMSKEISLLCVHGVSHSEIDAEFRHSWTEAITRAVQSCDPDLQPTIDFLEYDDLFSKAPLNLVTYGVALGKLLTSSVVHGIGDLLPRTRGVEDIPQVIRWTAGMVAQWSTDDELRENLRDLILKKMRSNSYDVVLAHSLGSLICYDTFVRNADEIEGKVFVSFGSQIGNPAVRDVFAGRIQALATHRWYHLFNPDDRVLTRALEIAADNFQQVIEQFDIPNDVLNHSATGYLSHANTIATVWRDVVGAPEPRAFESAVRGVATATAKPRRRALLIGINNYPDPANRLEGCVNDVFLMSSVLQESGFKPDEIRIVLDERSRGHAAGRHPASCLAMGAVGADVGAAGLSRPEPESRRKEKRRRLCGPQWRYAKVGTRHEASNQARQGIRPNAQGTRAPRALSADPARGLPGTGIFLRVPGRRDVLRRVHVLHGKGAAG